MSYIHCHTCKWSQDDFWTKSYNPPRSFWRMVVKEYIRPRYVKVDPRGAGMHQVHSWELLLRSVKRYARRVWHMHWWTRKAWIAALRAGKGNCPKCGNRLCED